MAKAGTLSVSILARTSSFTKGMKRVKRELRDVTRRAAQFGAVAVAAGAYMVRQQMQQIDTTGKLAARLRSSTQDIIALNKATKEAGGSAEGMQKMLQFLAKAAGEAAGGSLLTKRVFDGIGISMDALRSKSPVELMLQVSEALDRISNVNTRAAVAARLFGRQGVQNLNTLTNLRSKLDEVRVHTEKTGLAFSNIDAAKVEAANDAWGRVKDVLTGIATQTAIALSDEMLAISQALFDAATEGGNLGDKVTAAVDKIVIAVARATDFLQIFKAGFHGIEAVVYAVGEAIFLMTKRMIEPIRLAEQARNFFTPGIFETHIAENAASALDHISEDFNKLRTDALDKMFTAADNFNKGKNATAAEEFLAKAKINAEEIVKKMTETKKVAGEISTEGLDSLFGGGNTGSTKNNKPSLDLFQGDISRFALGFEGRMKKDKNPQIDKTNQLLEKILGKVGGPNVPVLG